MTTQEFREEFNLRYNNALQNAPGLDTYEISVYLTNAQEELVKKYYDISKDKTSSFELKERSRRVLNNLVKDSKVTTQLTSQRGIVDESKFFEISNSVMFIVLETIKLSSSNSLYDGKIIRVVPTTHDELMKSYRNPFRKPNKNKAWRVDLSNENSKTTVEIVTPENIAYYNVRYVTLPEPIIVDDLDVAPDVAGLGLTINGAKNKATSKLNELVHREIINRAVELAIMDYRENSLQARTALNERI